MPRSRVIIITVAAILLAVGVGGFLVYDQVLRGDSAAALTLPTASSSPAAPATAAPAASAPGASAAPAGSPAASPAASAAAGSVASVAGTWNIAAGSVAGYRVREQLAGFSAETDAVGRTESVTGSITVDTSGSATTLTGGTLSVDTTTIASDKAQRDGRLRTQGLETDKFPTATFTLTKPIEVPAAALTGTATDITLTGDLTVHGVTKSVEIPAQAQLANGTIQVAGSLAFPLSDFGMTAPNIGGFINLIADTGTLEFLVTFTKA